jgi:histone deacetylase 1/2
MENLPLGRDAIGNKWVFKVKEKSDGSVDRFKARLAAQGFSRRATVDYYETFSPIVKLITLSTIMAIASERNMHMHSADIETAFLNADLQEEIYTRQPRGAEDGTPRIMRLLKSIYGLKQASREWYKLFYQTLSSLGLKRATFDTDLLTMSHPVHGICIVMVYSHHLGLTQVV